MNSELLICVNFLGIIALCFLAYFVKTSIAFNLEWVKNYLRAIFINLFIIILDIVEYLISFSDNPIIIKTDIVLQTISYMFIPLLVMMLIYLLTEIKKYRLIALILCLINAFVIGILLIINLASRSEFSIDLFEITFIIQVVTISILFIGSLIFAILRLKNTHSAESLFVFVLAITILCAFLVEYLLSLRFLFWNSIALSLVFFFLKLNSSNLKKDILTGLPCRTVFERDMIRYLERVPIPIVVFDVNNLKTKNDLNGRRAGDQLLIDACQSIISSFTIGQSYRIGGNEFVYIGTEEVTLEKLNQMIENFIHQCGNEISISYGFAYTSPEINLTNAFQKADTNMYIDKTRIKREK